MNDITRKLATVRVIKELRPIPGADRIECAVIDGWEGVVFKSSDGQTSFKAISNGYLLKEAA